MKRYDEYKQTGTPWIGEIPSHWECKRLRFICSYKKGKNPRFLTFDKEDGMMPYLSMEYLRGSESNVQYTKLEDGLVEVSKNDMLLLWDGSNAGEFIISRDGVLSSTCAKLMVKELDDLFFKYYCFSIEKYLKDMTNGMGIPHVDSNVLKNILVFIPSLAEQEAIAAYLDKKCGSIDTVISTQKRRIALLEELKQSVITEAVTHGINPDAKLRPSGIDWIGEIPSHWQTIKLKYLLSGMQDGTHASFNRVESAYPLLSAKNVFEDGIHINDTESTVSFEDYKAIVSNGFPQKGDIALCCVGTIGRCCLYNYDEIYAFQRSVTFLRTNKNLSNKYLLYFLRSRIANEQMLQLSKTSAQSGIYMGSLSYVILPVPRLIEQEAIVEYIESKIKPIDASIAKAKREIELLKELKQSVITEAVTGKIKIF